MANIHDPGLFERLDSDANRPASWVERYRPRTLDQMALHPDARRLLESYTKSDRPSQPMILHGPPGTGKSTTAEILASRFASWTVARVNATETSDVQHMKDKVLPFLRAEGGMLRSLDSAYKQLLLVSEADGLSSFADAALKDVIEELQGTTSFIFTTNALDKMSEAIRSRCAKIEMLAPPISERWRILTSILANEGLNYDPSVAMAFSEAFSDMRELIRSAHDSFAMHGELRLPTSVGVSVEVGWATPVDGHDLLNGIEASLPRYLSLPEGAAPTIALWTVFAHAHEAFNSSPILAAVSPVKRAGKTRMLEVMSQLTPRVFAVSDISAATIHRLGGEVDRDAVRLPSELPVPPVATLFLDESENYIREGGHLRAAVDSGHTRRLALIPKYDRGELRTFSTFFPKWIGLIDKNKGEFPETVRDRSIVIPMQRRRDDENVERLRNDRDDEILADLKKKCVRWRTDHWNALRQADPPVPKGINDRAADSWRPLLAIADEVGGEWPEKARAACLVLCGAVDESAEVGPLLIGDIVSIFESDATKPDRLPTFHLLAALAEIQDRPWSSLTPIRLANHLRPFRIRSHALWAKVGPEKETRQGYYLKDFREAYTRYCGDRG